MKKLVPLVVLLLGAAYLVAGLFPPRTPGEFDLDAFGRLPALLNGRLKPLDTVARTTLLILQGRQRVATPENSTPLVSSPTAWLADMLFSPAKADTYPTFRIDSPEVQELMGITEADTKITYDSGAKRTMAILGFLPSSRSRFSFAKLQPKLADLDTQASLAQQTDAPARTAFQRAVLALREHILLYDRLMHSVAMPGSKDFLGEVLAFQQALPAGVAAIRAKAAGQPYDTAAAQVVLDAGERFGTMADRGYMLAIPPATDAADQTLWRNIGTALLDSIRTSTIDPTVLAYGAIGRAWNEQAPTEFNTAVRALRPTLLVRYGDQMVKTTAEARFNAAAPFYNGMTIFVAAFLIGVISWLVWPVELGRAAFWLVGLGWTLTTVGLITRMWLESRPPVTNLYSSALFIGWGSVLLCLVLEWIYRNAIASVAAGLIGFCTLLIAHFLSLNGDTMEMMVAVLDSNFWLATHVVMVTTGYASTFVAGILAMIYVARGIFTPSLDKSTAESLGKMVYGIICFATLFSFIGTVLGGIWADQSWGRFWGWDPKENGALIIVLWNALILHARWGGMVKRRGLMALALFGNVVTAWSWFGVNMLGIGLHSYGFTSAAFMGLILWVIFQLGLIAITVIPGIHWRSAEAA